MTLKDQYLKEQDGICKHLRSLRLLKNVSILGQPPLFGRVLGDVMKVNPATMPAGATEDDQYNYVLSWWGEVRTKRRRDAPP